MLSGAGGDAVPHRRNDERSSIGNFADSLTRMEVSSEEEKSIL
jgi:hypothetical protein